MAALRTLGVSLLLASLGAVCGAAAAVPITALGKLLTGAPAASMSNYLWNMAAFGLIAAIGSPLLTWSVLRRVPLWRAIGEPAIGAIVGGAIALGIGAPAAFLLLMPAGIGVAAWRLQHTFREPTDGVAPLLSGSERDAQELLERV